MEKTILKKVIACPLCQANLDFTEEKVNCVECQYESFYVNGIPWVFIEPKATLAEWQNRFSNYLQSLSAEISAIEASLKDSSLLTSTRNRLRQSKKDKQKQSKYMRELLEPLKLPQEMPGELFKALKTTLPMSQRLMSYEDNVFRDWAWDSEENQVAVDLVKEATSKAKFSELVVVGAGACRLPVDLHNALGLKQTVAIDINPYLFFAAKNLVEGKNFSLMEFPLSPKERQFMAVENQFKGQKVDGFRFVFSDALNLSVHSGSCEAVMTPWLIDIIPQDIDVFFRQLNRILQPGGTWINFGSFAFHHSDPSICYSKEEVFEIIENTGFQVEECIEREIPYLHSPYSCQKRFENVLCFNAKKVKEVDEYEDYHYLPDWITNPSLEVPDLDLFKSYVFINQIQFEVLRAVDGKISIEQIAAAIAVKYKMQMEQAIEAVRGFFTKVYEENLFRSL